MNCHLPQMYFSEPSETSQHAGFGMGAIGIEPMTSSLSSWLRGVAQYAR